MKRRLVVNADDFGFTRDVNEGIVEAHRAGILTATTLMANGSAFEHAVRLARETPSLDVGCHLVLVGGRSLVGRRRQLPATVWGLAAALAARRLQVVDELAAQVERILAAGIRPTHADTHKHTHLLPPVLEAVIRVAERYGIAWVRRPFDFPLRGMADGIPWGKRVVSRSLGILRRRMHRALEEHGRRTTDHFVGFQMSGAYGTRELVNLLRRLPAGTTELMCHPGYCGDELRRARTRLKESRARELAALTAPEVRQVLAEEGIELTAYRAL